VDNVHFALVNFGRLLDKPLNLTRVPEGKLGVRMSGKERHWQQTMQH
jgi:hypothetical protein